MANNLYYAKRTTISGRTPNTTGSYATNSQYISTGELALNLTDFKMFTSNGTSYFEIGSNIVNQSVTGNLSVAISSSFGSNGLNATIPLNVYANNNIAIAAYSNTNDAVYASSVSGYGVYSFSNSSISIYGSSNGGAGVYGTSTVWYGVQGYSISNPAIYGQSNSAAGVQGVSNTWYGVEGVSTSGGGVIGISNSGVALGGTSNSGTAISAASNTGYGIYCTSNTGSPMYVANATSTFLLFTANGLASFGYSIGVGANVSLTTSTFLIGNSTVNTSINSTSFYSGNSTVYTSGNSISDIWVGTTTNTVVNSTTIMVGNSTVYTTGNSISDIWVGTTTNTVVNSTTIMVGNSTVYTTGNSISDIWVGTTTNAVINATTIMVGNSVSNVTVNTSSITIPVANVGNYFTANSTAITVGGVNVSGLRYDIGQQSIPFIMPSSGTMGNNGALTAITALLLTYPNAYLYFPTGAISAGSAAGWYYTVMSSTTAGTVYNNVYISGTPTIPGTPTAFVTTGPGAYTQTTGAAITGYTLSVLGGVCGLHGGLFVDILASYNNTAGNKIINTFFSTYKFGTTTQTTSESYYGITGFVNRGSLTNQISRSLNTMGTGVSASNPLQGAINSATNQNLTIQVQLATATDYIVIERVGVNVTPSVP